MDGSPRQFIFDVSIRCIGRALLIRDVVLGRVKRSWRVDSSDHCASRFAIQSGRNTLDAVLMKPRGETRVAVLICHGIGETVQHWFRVQQLLAANGVASLVFDYSGYGQSSGRFGAAQSRRDLSLHFIRCRGLSDPHQFRCSGSRSEVELRRRFFQRCPRMACCSVRLSRLYETRPPAWAYRDSSAVYCHTFGGRRMCCSRARFQ
jgi:hypothetical protein